MKKPIISFCIPTYNRAQRVYKCVTHILSHQSDEIEVVVSNNASTDNTFELLKSISDKRLKIFSNEKNILAQNWPLAVSRANGMFAALMSDEDIVCLENIPHYLEFLLTADKENIGAILYNFPPINDNFIDYKTKNHYDSYFQAFCFGGHITGHVLNMRFFKLRELDEYGTVENYVNNRFNPGICEESQYQILLDIAKDNTVMIKRKPLIAMGKLEEAPKTKKISFDTITWNGLGPKFRKELFTANVDFIMNNFTDDTISRDSLLIQSMYRLITLTSMICSIALTLDDGDFGPFNPILIKEMRRVLIKDRETAKGIVCDCFAYASSYLQKATNSKKWGQFIPLFNNALNGSVKIEYSEKIGYYERLMLGNSIMYIQILFFSTYTKGFGHPEIMEVPECDDPLEIVKTTKMHRMILKKQYDDVIRYDDVSIFRANYLRGQAYFFKNEHEKARECFENFLDVVLNPKYLSDIITGTRAVQYSFYYLGKIHEALGDLNKSIEYFSKCHDLTQKLLLGYNLNLANIYNNTAK